MFPHQVLHLARVHPDKEILLMMQPEKVVDGTSHQGEVQLLGQAVKAGQAVKLGQVAKLGQVVKQTLENRYDKVIEDADLSFIDLQCEAVRQGWDARTRNMEETVLAQNKDTKLANLVNQKDRCSERLSSLINQHGMIIPLNKSKSERYGS